MGCYHWGAVKHFANTGTLAKEDVEKFSTIHKMYKYSTSTFSISLQPVRTIKTLVNYNYHYY